MAVDRWHLVTEIFHGALARDGEARQAFVADASKDDPSLRGDVERLLAAHESAGSFADIPVFATASKPLSPGSRLGSYRIDALIGAGGMGEVYRATDTRLDRVVAIKILPLHLRLSPALRARFEREARTISQLTHPHICTLHDVGHEHDVDFLVMEHLEGETVAVRLERGALPLDQALRVGIEIASALDHAHRHGIVHRDLKPANVMLTTNGAKLLDFGLAKLRLPAAATSASRAAAADSNTAEGTLLGTLPYMPPEQLEGKEADPRSDIWALGCVLYELTTGSKAFESASEAGLIAAILERHPEPLADRQPLAPPLLDDIVRRCLEKDPDERWQSAGDIAHALTWCVSADPRAPQSQVRRRPRVYVAAAALAIVAAFVLGGFWFATRETTVVPAPVHALLDVAGADELYGGPERRPMNMTVGGSHTALCWTPDGRSLVYAGFRDGVQQLYVRALGRTTADAIAGTRDAYEPVVSGDGQWLAFWSAGAIRKVPITGGAAAVLVADVPPIPMGMAWSAAGLLYSGAGGRIWYAPPGGTPTPVTTLEGTEHAHALPSWLPDGKAFLYTVRRRSFTWGNDLTVVQMLATGERRVILDDGVDARYAAGALVFMRLGTLFAGPFDTDARRLTREPAPVVSRVSQALRGYRTGYATGAGQFAVSSNGHLAYIDGGILPIGGASRVIAVDLNGHVTPEPLPAGAYTTTLRVSPDGRQFVTMTAGLTDSPLVVLDRPRAAQSTLAQRAEFWWPVWMPDSKRIVSLRISDHERDVVIQPADGSAAPEHIADGSFDPSSASPDGRLILGLKNGDVWVLDRSGTRPQLRPVVRSPLEERWPAFSPDGRWIAYGVADSSGNQQIYVQAYPGPSSRAQVSIDRGSNFVWAPSGRELFFLRNAGATVPGGGGRETILYEMLSARVEEGKPIGRPRVLFKFDPADLRNFVCIPLRCFDVDPDGQRFYLSQPPPLVPAPQATRINVVFNWIHEVNARYQASR